MVEEHGDLLEVMTNRIPNFDVLLLLNMQSKAWLKDMQSIGKDVWQGDDGAPRCLSLYTGNHASRRHKVQGLSEEEEESAKLRRPREISSLGFNNKIVDPFSRGRWDY